MKSIKDLHQLRDGYLQNDIDYIIYWVEGFSAYKERNYKKALKYFNLMLPKFGKNFSEYETHLKLGEIYYNLSLPDSSINHYRTALNKAKNTSMASNKLISKIYANIGANCVHRGDYEKAEKLLEDALKIQLNEKILPESDILITYRMIGHLNLYRGNFVESLENYKKSLNISNNLPVKNYYDIGASYLNISNAFVQLNKLDSGSIYAHKALNIQNEYYQPLYSSAYSVLGTRLVAIEI